MATTPDLEEVAGILKRHLPPGQCRAFLFGSRATGDARPMSDWDIGVLGPAALRGAVLQAIREDLEELRTLHTFDVVDLSTTSEAFRKAALEGAVLLL